MQGSDTGGSSQGRKECGFDQSGHERKVEGWRGVTERRGIRV